MVLKQDAYMLFYKRRSLRFQSSQESLAVSNGLGPKSPIFSLAVSWFFRFVRIIEYGIKFHFPGSKNCGTTFGSAQTQTTLRDAIFVLAIFVYVRGLGLRVFGAQQNARKFERSFGLYDFRRGVMCILID